MIKFSLDIDEQEYLRNKKLNSPFKDRLNKIDTFNFYDFQISGQHSLYKKAHKLMKVNRTDTKRLTHWLQENITLASALGMDD